MIMKVNLLDNFTVKVTKTTIIPQTMQTFCEIDNYKPITPTQGINER